MIQLHRIRSTAIPTRFRGAQRITHERELLTARRDHLATAGSKFDFLKGSMWGPSKPQLEIEAQDKCGYCEASAKATAHCDVEHIRPKSVYWWLALCYDNYVLACQICNQSNKGDQYPVVAALVGPALLGTTTDTQINGLSNTFAPDPLHDDATHKFSAFQTALRGEDPDLINPYHENPETFFVWAADAVLAEVEVRPAATGGRDRARAISTIAILGLNREELRRLRFDTYRSINALCLALIQGLTDPIKTAVEDAVRKTLEDRHAFAAMNRHLVRQIHGLPL